MTDDTTSVPGEQPLPFPEQFPEPHPDRQHERWALVADFTRDRERAIADGETR
jgi:hypothetical protein